MDNLNTWEVLKEYIGSEGNPGTMKRHMALNKAAEAFAALRDFDLVKDADAAVGAFNDDQEVTQAFMSRGIITELEKAGVI